MTTGTIWRFTALQLGRVKGVGVGKQCHAICLRFIGAGVKVE
jgi:hypothetical protein